MKRVMLAGGTGLVGSILVQNLSADGGFETTALVRRPGAIPEGLPRTRELVFDFDRPADYQNLARDSFEFVFCCLGTTIKKAGSAEHFRRVDLEYPSQLLKAMQAAQPVFGLVSSVGADAPKGLYLRTKAELEKEVLSSGLLSVIVRPSLLLGERKEFRLGELLSIKTLGPLSGFLRHGLGEGMAKYAPVHASTVALALLNAAKQCARDRTSLVLEGRAIERFGMGT